MPDDRRGEHDHRRVPGAALAATHAPGEHDERDAGERDQCGRGLGYADRQEAQDGVQVLAQRRRDRDGDVRQAREDERAGGHAAHEALVALSRERAGVLGPGLPVGP